MIFLKNTKLYNYTYFGNMENILYVWDLRLLDNQYGIQTCDQMDKLLYL